MLRRITIAELLAAQEGEQVQFKEAKRRFDFEEAAKICCALANCGGGMLVLGITDKRPRRIVGSEAFPQPERQRKSLMEKLDVMVDFSVGQGLIYRDGIGISHIAVPQLNLFLKKSFAN